MKKQFQIILYVFLSLVIVAGSGSVRAASKADIQSRCKNVQTYFQATLKPRDLKGRVDRLQAYQYIFQELDGFAKRLESNNQTGAREIRIELTTYSKLIERFKIDYEIYDQSRDATSRIVNCPNNVEDFSVRLQATREARAQLNNDIAQLDKSVNETLKNRLQKIESSLKGEKS